MAQRKTAQKPVEKITVLNPETGELTDLAPDVLPNRGRSGGVKHSIQAEAQSKKRMLGKGLDWADEHMGSQWSIVAISLAVFAVGLVFGLWGKPLYEARTQEAQIARALQTSIPVVQATEVAIDPGKFVNKLTDVVMVPTTGAVFRSRKGLFLAENSLGLSLTIFESAFEVFQEAYGVETADDIAPYLIGKTIKARGIVQQRMQNDGTFRTSMIIQAPGLIQILPDHK